MADDNSTPAMPAALTNHGVLLNSLLDIKGTVVLSRQSIYNIMSRATLEDDAEESAKILQAAEGTLTITEAAIERLYEQLEGAGQLWPSLDEVAHG